MVLFGGLFRLFPFPQVTAFRKQSREGYPQIANITLPAIYQQKICVGN